MRDPAYRGPASSRPDKFFLPHMDGLSAANHLLRIEYFRPAAVDPKWTGSRLRSAIVAIPITSFGIVSLRQFSPGDETSYERQREKLHRRKLAPQPHRRNQRQLVLLGAGRDQIL
jgi:hypothetical protein